MSDIMTFYLWYKNNMEYTFEYIDNKIDKRFFGLTDHISILKLQKEIKGIHNQNRINLNFALSDIYRDNSCYDEFFEHYKTLENEEKRPFQLKVFEGVKERYIELDKNLRTKTPENLCYEDLEEYITLLPRHLDAMTAAYTHVYQKWKILFCRFGCNRLIGGLKKDEINYVLENTQKIKTHLDTNYNFSEKLDLNWHIFLTTCWTLIEGGVAEVSLFIAEEILRLFDIQMEKHKSAAQFTFVALYRSVDTRSKFTILWIKALSLIQLNREEEAKQTLQYMIDFLSDSNFHSYVIYNRMAEASILLYLLEPNEKHSNQAKKSILLTAERELIDSTETVRERGLIIYDFCKYILKVDI